jgi:curli production assembly/transport component CsgF
VRYSPNEAEIIFVNTSNDGISQKNIFKRTLGAFAENLNRQLLNQLSRSIFTSQLGNGLQEGTFNFGSLAIEIFDSPEGLVINILDTNTGEQTQIIVPN